MACARVPQHTRIAFLSGDIGSELTEVQKAHVARVRLLGELEHGVDHERGRHHGAASAREEASERDGRHDATLIGVARVDEATLVRGVNNADELFV